MEQIKKYMIPFLTRREIAALTTSIAHRIERDYEGKEIIFICPLRGSFLFLADLIRKVNIPQIIDFVQMNSVDGTITLTKDISVNLTGKHVIIAEEIIDAGRKVAFLKERILQTHPASLKVVALLDKPARRVLPVHPDYVGLTIEDRYVVGYGMDSDDLGRNYAEIFIYPS